MKPKSALILTNWNSVAAPAPASAFLSAPAGGGLIIINYNQQQQKKKPEFSSYLRGAADRLYVSLSASARFKRAGLSPSIPTQLQENKDKKD